MKIMKVVATLALVVIATGCASVSQQRARIPLANGGHINLTGVDWGVGPHGGSVNNHYFAETVLRGKTMDVKVYAQSSQVGTGQQVLANLASSLPGAIAYGIGAGKTAGAIRDSGRAAARAQMYTANKGLEATKYAVDNPSGGDLTVVYTNTEVGVDVDVNQEDPSSCAGDACF